MNKLLPLLAFSVLLLVPLGAQNAFAGGFDPESCEECEPFRTQCLGSPQDPAVCNRLADQCLEDLMCSAGVGGEIIPIETTSLVLAGAQSFSWMIPIALSVLGIGLFAVSRKSENS